jgi:methyl-accepting chemotaxis protein
MKMKFRLGVSLVIITAVVVTGITILLLRQASGISYYLNIRSLGHLTSQYAEFWKGQEDGYLKTLHTLANVMGDYESIKVSERRDRYDDMLRSTLEGEPQMAAVYTVWKPNAIDGMDSKYIDRKGSSSTGLYAMAYFREANKITGRVSADIDNVIAHISGPNARKDRIENPAYVKIKGTNRFVVKMTVPITNRLTDEVVGGIGCFLFADSMQGIVENTLKNNGEIAMMAMYSGNGTILAHYLPERIGKRMIDADMELSDSRQPIFRAMQSGKSYMDTVYNPKLHENIIYIMKPFQIGNSGHNWAMLTGVMESYVLKDVKTITRFAIMLAATTVLLTAIIIFSILKTTTKPIERVTDALKDLSEGKGDLTQVIPEDGDDEITDMVHYFNKAVKKIKNMIIVTKQQAAVLSDTGSELSSNMTQTAAVITQIIADLKNIKSRLIDQTLSASQTEAIMEKITDSVGRLKECMEKQATNMVQASSSVRENIHSALDGSHEAALENRYLGLVNEEITADINEMAAGADQINTAVTKISEISRKNRENIDLLVRGAAMFKVA